MMRQLRLPRRLSASPLRWRRSGCVGTVCLFVQLFSATAQQEPANRNARAERVVAETIVAPGDVVVSGDAIRQPLTTASADAARGKKLVLDRAVGNCLICHRLPIPSEPFQGTVGPDLAGVASRLTPDQIRLRVVDQSRLSPATLMPPFYRTDDLTRVDPRYRDKPVLSALQIEDVVAYLSTLQE